ncbi:hypothetical protein PC123_g22073 [Phytophthora cactorum]|nr:hypothetical protein PC123_g22073 [Phytophthora cactorum]
MEPTVYGTSSLAVDERLASQMNNKRRAFVKWGVFGVATCGICSTLALLGTSPVHEDAIAEAMRLTTSAFKNAAPAVDAEVTCFQSSYIDNRYGHDIMTDLNNHVVGWVDWNLLLDHKGGPNHQGNNCDAPIILTEDGTDFHIQPMFYFIQHFSKYIPVGSRRVKTHVAARFEKPGDAQLMWAYPTALASCDGSARQTMHVTNDNKIEVTGSGFCLGMVDAVWQGKEIQMEQCQFTQQSWTFEEETGRIRVDDFCLSLNHASSADGVRLTASRCEAEIVPHQQWTFNEEDGTLRSRASTTDQCATGGYSFVQATAFVTPEDRKVLVVMNENTEAADFEIQVGDMVLETSIPKGAIRTFTWM